MPLEVAPEPGHIVAVTTAGRRVAVANVDGELFAFQDECTHEECPLSDGDLEGHLVVCICHGGTFDVRTGEPVEGPVYVPLKTFAVVRTGEVTSIDLDGDGSPVS